MTDILDKQYFILQSDQLATVARHIQFPFHLQLPDASWLEATEMLRIIPGKRLVVAGTWQHRAIVAKIFLKPNRASYQAKREVAGWQALWQAGIATPRLLHHISFTQPRVHILLFERIIPAISLHFLWQQADTLEQKLTLLQKFLPVLVQHHLVGLFQRDLHLNNFLLAQDTFYTLDPAEIVLTKKPLSYLPSLDNLSAFLAQLTPRYADLSSSAYRLYAQARGWPISTHALITLQHKIQRWRQRLLNECIPKVFRECTAYGRQATFHRLAIWDRHYDHPALHTLLNDPDQAFKKPSQLLKNGHTCSVSLWTLQGQPIVIKRYNIKNSWHGLKRALSPSRAGICWRNAQRLQLLGIPTAKPIAMLEKRIGWFNSTAYFISEYIEGVTLQTLAATELTALNASIQQLFQQLNATQLSHGDMKASNILVSQQQLYLIDLDSMRSHQCHAHFIKAHRQDQQRFLNNWQQQPAVQKQLAALLSNEEP